MVLNTILSATLEDPEAQGRQAGGQGGGGRQSRFQQKNKNTIYGSLQTNDHEDNSSNTTRD